MDSQEQTLQFADQMPHWQYTVDSPLESTYGICDNPDDDIAKFFARPIKVQTYSWAVGAVLFQTFNPWTLFFTNPRVINRISNYMNLRCKLHVKFVINGTGFHYGRAIASYNPLHLLDNVTKDRAFFIQDIVAASQRPKVFLDPTKSKGGELNLPFFWYSNNLSIPDAEWASMGEIIIHGINPLKHANGAVNDVNVSVFVWAEDVVLSMPTSAEPSSIVPQSGDEYGMGVISRPMGILARAAGMLTSAPVLAPYAKATQIGANMAMGIAQLFGYSRPTVVTDVVQTKYLHLGNMVNTQISDTSIKCTLDPKQELTIDARTMGLGPDDEMSIKSIAMRESYLTTFDWGINDTTESFLFQCKVTPCLWNQLTVSGQTEYHMTSSCFASMPFAKWRGTTKFRFQIVASAYHKGRLKVVYEPFVVASNEYNTNFVHIVDLAKQRDFAVDIGWGHPKSFCNTTAVDGGAALPFTQTAPLGTGSTTLNDFNGYISVYCVNELTTPNSVVNNDIQVNVFVSMCDDFEVADPTSRNIDNLSVFPDLLVAQSGNEREDFHLTQPDGDRGLDEDIPMDMPVQHSMAPSLELADRTLDVYYGDPITSFRQLLKRYTYYTTLIPPATTSNIFKATLNNFPENRGFAPDGFSNANIPVNPTRYNYLSMTLLNYVSLAYGARRGGIRWKAMTGGTATFPTLIYAQRINAGVGTTATSNNVPISDTTANNNQRTNQFVNSINNTLEGIVASPAVSNPVVEYEMPFYDFNRFYLGKRVTAFAATKLFNFHTLFWQYFSGAANNPHIHLFVSTGEDFTCAFFLGAPVFYSYTNPAPSLTVPGS